jgi:hypothetical protein
VSNEPLFLRFINREVTVEAMLQTYSKAPDLQTSEAAIKAIVNFPDLESFRVEMIDAVTDLIRQGVGEEFRAFVNNYMESSLEEKTEIVDGQLGQNISRVARVKDSEAPWLQGFICYNLCLYIKAYGLDDLKKCKVCSMFFNHKGKYAVYCSDKCKAEAKTKKL